VFALGSRVVKSAVKTGVFEVGFSSVPVVAGVCMAGFMAGIMAGDLGMSAACRKCSSVTST